MEDEKQRYFTDSPRAIDEHTRQFYLLLDLDILLETKGVTLPGFKRAFGEYCKAFARSIYDYLVMTSIGEARHARMYTDHYCPQLTIAQPRETTYAFCHMFDPVRSIPALKTVYDKPWSECGFGGLRWGAVVKLIEKYGEMATIRWIDEVINLQHNGGSVFYGKDKIFTINDTSELSQFLDYRRRHTIFGDNTSTHLVKLDSIWRPFLEKALQMEYIPSKAIRIVFSKYTEGFVTPINWGFIELIVEKNDKRGKWAVCNKCQRYIYLADLCQICYKLSGTTLCSKCCSGHDSEVVYMCEDCGNPHYVGNKQPCCGKDKSHCTCKVYKCKVCGGMFDWISFCTECGTCLSHCEEEEDYDGEEEYTPSTPSWAGNPIVFLDESASASTKTTTVPSFYSSSWASSAATYSKGIDKLHAQGGATR